MRLASPAPLNNGPHMSMSSIFPAGAVPMGRKCGRQVCSAQCSLHYPTLVVHAQSQHSTTFMSCDSWLFPGKVPQRALQHPSPIALQTLSARTGHCSTTARLFCVVISRSLRVSDGTLPTDAKVWQVISTWATTMDSRTLRQCLIFWVQ